jgi:hypothetical protein
MQRGCLARRAVASADAPGDPGPAARRRRRRHSRAILGVTRHCAERDRHTSEGPTMHEIQVSVTSTELADDGTAELWYGGELIAFTHYEAGDLMLRIEPRRDGAAVVVGAQAMVAALAEVDRVLARY